MQRLILVVELVIFLRHWPALEFLEVTLEPYCQLVVFIYILDIDYVLFRFGYVLDTLTLVILFLGFYDVLFILTLYYTCVDLTSF